MEMQVSSAKYYLFLSISTVMLSIAEFNWTGQKENAALSLSKVEVRLVYNKLYKNWGFEF